MSKTKNTIKVKNKNKGKVKNREQSKNTKGVKGSKGSGSSSSFKYYKNNQVTSNRASFKKVGRKSYSNKDMVQSGGQELYLDSLSSFKEYLKFDPSSIKGVYYTNVYESRVKQLIDKEKRSKLLEGKLHLIDKENQDETGLPFRVEIKVDTLDLEDLIGNLKDQQKAVVVACDHILDPRNLGAIIRSSAFLGVGYILVSENRQAPISQTVISTSMGGTSLVKLVRVVNIFESLKRLKKEGFWIIGTSMDGEDFRNVAGFYDKTVLVLGSEDKGISQRVYQECDRMVSINSSSVNRIDSLNVSVAAGILIAEFLK